MRLTPLPAVILSHLVSPSDGDCGEVTAAPAGHAQDDLLCQLRHPLPRLARRQRTPRAWYALPLPLRHPASQPLRACRTDAAALATLEQRLAFLNAQLAPGHEILFYLSRPPAALDLRASCDVAAKARPVCHPPLTSRSVCPSLPPSTVSSPPPPPRACSPYSARSLRSLRGATRGRWR